MNPTHVRDASHRPHTLQVGIGIAVAVLATVVIVRTVDRAPDAVPFVTPTASAAPAAPAFEGQRFVPTTEGKFGEIEPLPPQF